MRLISLCKSKIHRATVTDTNVDYEGSITVDSDLMERVEIVPWERVHVWNVTNGNRFETYVTPAPKYSGIVCVNGAAAHLCNVGDKIIVAAFVLTDEEIMPKIILVDEKNRFLRFGKA